MNVIVSIYVAAQSERYHPGALRLLPSTGRSKVSQFFDATAPILGRWLVRQS